MSTTTNDDTMDDRQYSPPTVPSDATILRAAATIVRWYGRIATELAAVNDLVSPGTSQYVLVESAGTRVMEAFFPDNGDDPIEPETVTRVLLELAGLAK